MYAHSHPNRGSKRMHSVWKNGHILLKNVLLKLNFLDGSYFYGNCLFHILTIYHRCLFFQFWCCGIRMHICILTSVQKGRIYSWKQGHILLTNVLLKINFEHEGHLYANCLFCVFYFFVKCFFFNSQGVI